MHIVVWCLKSHGLHYRTIFGGNDKTKVGINESETEKPE